MSRELAVNTYWGAGPHLAITGAISDALQYMRNHGILYEANNDRNWLELERFFQRYDVVNEEKFYLWRHFTDDWALDQKTTFEFEFTLNFEMPHFDEQMVSVFK